jgi:hypothetical protein
MNRRAACQALCALLIAACTPALGQRKPKPPLAWAELTAEQQEILAPLKPDWESLEPERRRKWLGVAKRYPKMTPRGQQRVQKRMQAWAKLTPEQRRQARENYKRMAKASPEKRRELREQWAEYQRQQPRRGAPSAPPQ